MAKLALVALFALLSGIFFGGCAILSVESDRQIVGGVLTIVFMLVGILCTVLFGGGA